MDPSTVGAIDTISNDVLDWFSILTGRRPAMPTTIDASIILAQQQLQQQQQTRWMLIIGGAALLYAFTRR